MWKLSFAMVVACTGGGQSPLPDAGDNPNDDGGSACTEDTFEPNNTTAFATGVGETLDRITILSELCPAGDVELFSLVIGSTGLVFEATLATEDGTLLDLALFGDDGATILDGDPTGVPGEIRIAIPSTPDLGRVLVRVGGNGKHAYRLALDLRP